jgi:hypothetical protein
VIALTDTSPVVDVEPAQYVRLLGYPPGRVVQGRAAELAAWAREWYAANGRPWVVLRGTERLSLHASGAGLPPRGDARGAGLPPRDDARGAGLQPRDDARGAGLQPCVSIDDVPFTASRLRTLLQQSNAHGVVLAAVSAGAELEAEAQRLWKDDKPDEYFFLEMYGSAVVEHLAMATGARLCAWAEALGMAVLPHDSPGYDGWDIGEQPRLLPLVAHGAALPGPLRVLESGALVPKKSLLAVYGVTRNADAPGRRLASMVPCEQCSLARCQYRRRPYRHASDSSDPMWGRASALQDDPMWGRALALQGDDDPSSRTSALQDPSYRTSRKALQRWARERLTLTLRDDDGVDARFRYDGTTCTNMGRELSFLYEVTLGPRDEGYPIREQRCAPSPGDAGHTAMCGYIRDGEGLMAAIADERSLAGQRLDDVLSWARPTSAAGCYCDRASREHKWGLVLETIHLALAEKEREAAS